MGPHTHTTQHNRKNDPSLWDTLAHRWDEMQRNTAQQEEGPITMQFTSATFLNTGDDHFMKTCVVIWRNF
jgi:hypothetical protein